ncbi:MAG: hypothetical protein AAGH99_12245 [Planctomycetota bacterium]
MSPEDQRHLDLMSVFHYLVAGLAGCFGLFPIIHLVIGVLALTGVIEDEQGQALPPIFGVIFVAIPLVFMATAWSLAIALVLAGRRLKNRRSHRFCFVLAAIECVFIPLGTVLGVFTILVLSRPSVKAAFEGFSNDPPEITSQ